MQALVGFLAFASTALAAPQMNGLAHFTLHQLRQEARLDLQGGTCGGTSGFGCAEGFCCSQWGYCGQGEAYCGSVDNNRNQTDVSTKPWAEAGPGAPSPVVAMAKASPMVAVTDSHVEEKPAKASQPAEPSPQNSTTCTTPGAGETGCVADSARPSPSPSSDSSSGSGGRGLGDVYTSYQGDGSVDAGWPSMDQWASFDRLWSANVATMGRSCAPFSVPNNSAEETADIESAIRTVAASTGVDSRFILAVMMQESNGCVRAPTTRNPVRNPGLMQDHDGKGTCNDGGLVKTPCPSSEILQMLQDGVGGTSTGDGLQQILAQRGSARGAQRYYEAARVYNSGDMPANGNLVVGGATNCYPSDLANRLTGWATSATKCSA